MTTDNSSDTVTTMNVVLNDRQIDTLSEFLANMAVAWFIAAFITPQTAQSLVVYTSYGVLSLYTALFLKGG